MKQRFILVLIFALIQQGINAQIFNPVSWTHELKITGKNTGEIIHKAKIDDKWHMYGMNIPDGGPRPTKIVYSNITNAEKVGNVVSKSRLEEVYDKSFEMKLTWYAKEAIFVQKIKFQDAAQVKVEGYVAYMVCDDERCLPPVEEDFSLGNASATSASSKKEETPKVAAIQSMNIEEKTEDIVTAEIVVSPVDSTLSSTEIVIDSTQLWSPVIEKLKSFGDKSKADAGISLWLIFLAGLAGGFLALFTPCVWPIIPMTVSFFLKRSENKAKARGDAILYGLSIIVIYVALGILITVLFGASALNSMSTNAVFNLIFFAMLVVFAISFFGAFEISLPASWSTKLDAKAESTAGFMSILFMAFTLALVSFSCTGPIIGTLLVEVGSSGNLIAPAIGMLGFAVALAIPFTFFAFFPSLLKSMPKSGGWLNQVKIILAFLELALALKFLSVADLAYGWGILDREVFVSLWIIIFALLGFYLLGKIRFPHDSESKHTSVLGTFLAIISLSFALYMVPGLWGAPLKAISAFTPPLTTQDFNLYKDEVHAKFLNYEEGMKYAKSQGKPVVIDFTGYGCVNCRKMEASVWTNPEVKKRLDNDFVLISLYVDDKTSLKEPFEVVENGKSRKIKTIGDKWSYLQRIKFGANAQPYYVMLDEKGDPLTYFYEFDDKPENFLNWLNKK